MVLQTQVYDASYNRHTKSAEPASRALREEKSPSRNPKPHGFLQFMPRACVASYLLIWRNPAVTLELQVVSA